MSLATTMGIELSYVPQAIQTAFNRGATFDPQSALGERSLTDGFASLLRHMVKLKKIPTYNQVHTDPGCVEVATKPYSKLSTLLSVARRIGREAEALGLTPAADYTGGGGAHIHTGMIGDTEEERLKYARRMMLFGAMNPWLSWACINIVDDINAAPITREQLLNEGIAPEDYLRGLENEVRNTLEMALLRQRQSHGHDEYSRQLWGRRTTDITSRYSRARLRLHQFKVRMAQKSDGAKTTARVDKIVFMGDKGAMLRRAYYGAHGTIEFRVFEMGDEAKLKRNVFLANAVCQYVERWGIDTFNLSDVPTAERLWDMSWREAHNGWLKMLDLLGLDRADYRDETANIARRWRHWRAQGGNPAGIEKPRARVEPDQEAREQHVERAQARHARKEAKRARLAARRAALTAS